VSEIPPYLTPSQVGKACGMTRRQAKSLLDRAGILEKIGGRWAVGDEQLRERLPRVYDRVYAHTRLPGRKRPVTT
jgi:hypothetical protein